MENKTVCFMGHRNVELSDENVERLKDLIENLIVNENVNTFLFGTQSDFNYICRAIVTNLREKYPFIQRKGYPCRSECFILESERENWERILMSNHKREFHILGVEEEVYFKDRWFAGKASYVERNQAMIKDSDICIFYYDENYQPPRRKYSERSLSTYQPKSGTMLAYNYAKQKKKEIINVFDILK